MRGQFHRNMCIYNCNVHKEPQEAMPPLLWFSSSHGIALHLIIEVYTTHVVVVCLHNWVAGNLNHCSVALLSTDSVVPHGIGLRAQKINWLLILPYSDNNVLPAKEQQLPLTKLCDSLSRRGNFPQDAFLISTTSSTDINAILKQIFCESKRIEKIINRNMMVFAYQGLSEIVDNMVSYQ